MESIITKPSQIDILFVELDRAATDALNDNKVLYVDWYTEKPEVKQTPKQRNAMHVWCGLMADTLNECGFLRKKVRVLDGEIVEVEWTKESFKEDVYKFLLDAITLKKSTEEQKTTDHEIVYRNIVNLFGEKGVQCPPWPSNR